MTRLAEKDVEREARRVLRRLAGPRQFLLRRSGGDYAVARNSAALAAARVRLEADYLRAFLDKGWLAAAGPDRFVIAGAGVDFLTRSFGGADGFAAQHRLMHSAELEGEGATRIVQVNAGESPLARLKFRGLIDGTQFAAGEKLRRDFTLGQLTARMGVNWEAPVVSGGRGAGGEGIGDAAMAARRRVGQALGAVGPGLSDLLFDVCCHLMVLERAENSRGWARRSGRVVLMIALDRLAAHYGMAVTVRRGPIRAWSAPEASGVGVP